MNQRVLTNELVSYVKEIVADADAGDAEARKWLLDAFPDHKRFMLALWAHRPVSQAQVRGGAVKSLQGKRCRPPG